MLVQPFKPGSSHLEFVPGPELMVDRWTQSEIGQVSSDQHHVRLGKILEVEGIKLAVYVADRQDSHGLPRDGCTKLGT